MTAVLQSFAQRKRCGVVPNLLWLDNEEQVVLLVICNDYGPYSLSLRVTALNHLKDREAEGYTVLIGYYKGVCRQESQIPRFARKAFADRQHTTTLPALLVKLEGREPRDHPKYGLHYTFSLTTSGRPAKDKPKQPDLFERIKLRKG